MSKVDKIRLKILKAKIENKPMLFIQRLQQELDRLINLEKGKN